MVVAPSLIPREATGVKPRVALQNILVATDLSSSSLASLPYALEIARHYSSTIHLCTVITPPSRNLPSVEMFPLALERARHYAETRMFKLIRSGLLKGIPHQILIREGAVWEVLSELSQVHQVDLVVIGVHDGRRPMNLGVGPVTEQVLRWSPCPILSVGPNVSGTLWSEVQLKRILYCTDLTRASIRAASYALSFAEEYRADLILLHVVHSAPRLCTGSPDDRASRIEYLMRELVPEDADLSYPPEFVVECGVPADKILKTTAERSASLVVLGVRQQAASGTDHRWEVSHRVASEAYCPVLTFRARYFE